MDSSVAASGGIEGWIYLEKPLPGRLTFRLGTATEVASGQAPYTFRFGLDFTGWRMFRVLFHRDCRQPSTPNPQPSTLDVLEIAPPPTSPDGCLWLDALVIGPGVSPQRTADYQVPEHEADMGHWCAHWPLYYARQTPGEPLPEAITESQKNDFATIFERYEKWLLGPGQSRAGPSAVARRAMADTPGRLASSDSPLPARGEGQFQAYILRGWAQLEDLNTIRDTEGRIIGPGLVKDFGSPASFKHVFYDILMPIVFDYKVNGSEHARDTAFELFDYIHDQGWAEGSGLGDLWLLPLGFAPYCHAVVLMRDELRATGRLETAVRAAFWYLTFGKTFTRFDEAYVETNADAMRSILFTTLAMILALDDTPQKVQYMRGWWHWFNDALKISPRFTGLIKPDGLGFHHQAVYAGAYATEAYEFSSLIVWLLHDTEFAASPESIANLKWALKTQDTLTNHYDVPYTTMGRMPRPGIRILSAYAYLALAGPGERSSSRTSQDAAPRSVVRQDSLPGNGGRCCVEPDAELAGIFMRLWDPQCAYLGAGDKGTNYLPQVLNVDLDAQQGKFLFMQTLGRLHVMQELADLGLPAAPKPEGFFPKPWGALAIHRRGEWLLAVKGWSQYVWDFEMHPKSWAAVEENVYARYWSYGTLQPLTHGNPVNPVTSGWNLNTGWDWCRWPGATTKRLSLIENYDPKSSWRSRFFSTSTFVGAVSCEGRDGMFALKLRENFDDPTFRALKTYCFFDDLVVCLGSNIECRDDAHAIETTLFQCWMPEQTMPVEVNGERVEAFPTSYRGEPGHVLTLRDPYGHGYVLPDGAGVHLDRAVQHSRDAWNRGDTEGVFSTAWIDHGVGPREDGYGGPRYHYAMLVHATSERLAEVAEHPPYRVLQQDHRAHIVEAASSPLSGLKTTAYALFETDWIVPHGLVRRTDTPVLVMVREYDEGAITLSLADPDLRLPKRRNMGYLDDEANATMAKSSEVRLQLRGAWRLDGADEKVVVDMAGDEWTTLLFTCRYGGTLEVRLVAGG